MILGIGNDILEVDRMRRDLDMAGSEFRDRLFTPAEIAYCERKRYPAQHYAARFAAKEAFSKALGTGLRGAIGWSEIQVNDNERMRPSISVTGRARRFLGNRRVHVSLSHTNNYATAVVVIEEA